MSYRDDEQALRSYLGDLDRQLAALDERAAELAGVDAERARLGREATRLRTELEVHAARRRPVRLDALRVAAPCKERWDDMRGDAVSRHCQRCDQPVFNLSAMSRDQAEAFLAERVGPSAGACVRFYRRADGTVMTADCAPGARRRQRGLAAAAGLLASAAAGAGLLAHGAASPTRAVDAASWLEDPPEPPPEHFTMGAVAEFELPPPPPPPPPAVETAIPACPPVQGPLPR
jgi:hypothetical protein